MYSQPILDNVREFVLRRWELYHDQAASRKELAYLSPIDIEMLAADCGLSPGQFNDMVKRGPRAADELLELMRALGIDQTKLKLRDKTSFNEMKLICAGCRRKSVCRRSIRKGTATQNYESFCNNAELLREATRNGDSVQG
jgi:hypothetical protein